MRWGCSMFQYFWSYGSEIPKGVGFQLYGRQHLLWLLGIIIGIYVICKIYCGLDVMGRKYCARGVAFCIGATGVIRYAFLFFRHKLTVGHLPLHLCSMAVILCVIHAVTESRFLGDVLYCLCMPGAMVGLLFANWTKYPAMSFMSIVCFLAHGLVVLYPILMLISGSIRPRIKNIWRPILFLCMVVPPAYLVNKKYNTNFMFINRPSPGSPLVFLEQWLGNPGYLFGYLVLAAGVIALLYLPFSINRRKLPKLRKAIVNVGEKKQQESVPYQIHL